MFDHGMMKRVSDRVVDSKRTPFSGEDPIAVSGLRLVAKAFVDLQDWRRRADYGDGTFWNPLETINAVARAGSAFVVWNDIKHTDIAQEYLVSLLIRPRD
jgi:hypothetical protein